MKRVVAVAWVCVALASCADEPGIIEAKAFQLRDDEGKLRGSFDMNEEGFVELQVFGEDERTRARFGVSPDGSSFFQLFPAGKSPPALAMSVSSDGENTDLHLYTPRGHAIVLAAHGQTAQFSVAEPGEAARAVIGVNEKGGSFMRLDDENGNVIHQIR